VEDTLFTQIPFTQTTALMGLLVFQRYVFQNTGLFHSSHSFVGRELVQKCHGMCTKANLQYFETERKRNIYSNRRFNQICSKH
jgi:hypothetical protein